MRKTTAYARKRATRPTFNAAEWLNTIRRCAGYTDEAPIGSWLHTGTQSAADDAIAQVKAAFEAFKAGTVQPENEDQFDVMAEALGVSCIRAGQIAGNVPEHNAMLPPLIAGNHALRRMLARRRKWSKWEMLAKDAAELDWAVEIYETIVRSSSPAQMTEASDLRMKAFAGKELESST